MLRRPVLHKLQPNECGVSKTACPKIKAAIAAESAQASAPQSKLSSVSFGECLIHLGWMIPYKKVDCPQLALLLSMQSTRRGSGGGS